LIERKKEEILDFSRKTIILANKLVCRLFALVGFTLSGVQLRFWLLLRKNQSSRAAVESVCCTTGR